MDFHTCLRYIAAHCLVSSRFILAVFVQNCSFVIFMENITKRMRSKTFRHLMSMDVAYFDMPQHSTGKLTVRLATDASNVKKVPFKFLSLSKWLNCPSPAQALDWRLGTVIASCVGLGVGVICSFIFGWQLAIFGFLCTPLLVLGQIVEFKAREGTQELDTRLMEDAGKTTTEAIGNIRTVQSLTREDRFYQDYLHHLEKPYR